MVKPTELLAPAGNPEALDAAIGEGADAVYLGLHSFNARMRSSNFAFNQFEATVDVCRRQSKKVYVTVNTVFEQREADRMWQLLQYLDRVGPDGIIVQDLGVVKMAVDNFPKLALHASTQMNVASARGVNYLSRHGFKRAVLARELSLDEIRAIRQSTNLELETFVHGALCVSASGLCLFSGYLGGKSANRGQCTQACRRLYESDQKSGYFFSPDDLELIQQVPDLMEAGVDSFKIEGRMKSADYVGTVVAAYRYMMDNWRIDRERALLRARAILSKDFARRKTSFMVSGVEKAEYIHPDQPGGTGIPLGQVRDIHVDDSGARWAVMHSFDGIGEGDSVRIHRSDDSGRITAKVRGVKPIASGMLLLVDGEFRQSDTIYLVQTAGMSRRYKPLLPKEIAKYHKFPSRDLSPRPDYPAMTRQSLTALPDGLYVLVSKVGDLHAILSARPEKAMILFDRKNAEKLRAEEQTIPFKRESLVLWLDPYFPEDDAAWLEPEIAYWIGRGIKTVVVNNPGHFSLVRGKGLTVIAGPWLYAFNRWSAAFLISEGANYIIPPLEISKQNLQRIAENVPAAAFMPVVFSYPPLFRIRKDLSKVYTSKFFTDRDGGTYELVGNRDYSVVVPMKPFSLVDRIPFLKKEGMGKVILDFSHVDLGKGLYRHVMKAAAEGAVLPDTERFNWKEGFWSPEEKPT